MTEKRPTTIVPALPHGRLAQLIAEYEALKPMADRFDEIKKAVKVELTTAAPEATAIETGLGDTQLRVIYVERWSLDTDRMKKEAPELYVQYARKGGRWELRRA